MATDPTAGPAAAAAPSPPAWRRAAPFVLAAGLVAFVLLRLDRHAFLAAIARVDVLPFAAFNAVFLLALLSADTFATVIVYRRTIAPVGFGAFWVLRGASYLPSALNHHVGQAFITYFLARTHKVPLFRVAGATLLVYASWTACILALGAVAVVLNHQPAVWLLPLLGAGVVYLVVLALRPARLAGTRLLAPLFEAGIAGHFVAVAVRLPHLAVLFFGTWLPFYFFGVKIPLDAALAYIPLLMVATTLPLTPQGFGTRDVLAALFFERYAPGATHEERLGVLAATTTSWAVMLTLIELLLGLILLRRARLSGAEPPAAPPAAG